jgi:uncharacterized protein YjbJ (UPF0337 family)
MARAHLIQWLIKEEKNMLNMGEIKGKARQLVGAIKENLGWLTNDHKAEGEGKDERIEGKAQEHDARARREVEETEEELAGSEVGGK